ncbi:hypothetical protein QJS10_CPB14g00949 [Acorus calamus]|uniref:Secreted protein n=1 Tax=Acorus calamus TaxID=4465 RepID=A0AAV9DC05_ACOCL|nr:hypothetical protein QJS10_CPB14g00949 [Acorus calamus]
MLLLQGVTALSLPFSMSRTNINRGVLLQKRAPFVHMGGCYSDYLIQERFFKCPRPALSILRPIRGKAASVEGTSSVSIDGAKRCTVSLISNHRSRFWDRYCFLWFCEGFTC